MTNELISREAALDVLRNAMNGFRIVGMRSGKTLLQSAVNEAWEGLNNIPAVDAVPVVHGRWIHCDGKSNLWYCSECGGRIMYSQKCRTYQIKKPPVSEANKFCKHCGAKMDEEE